MTVSKASLHNHLPARSVTPTVIYPTLLEARAAGKELTIVLTDDLMLNLRRSAVFAEDVQRISSDEGSTLEEYVSSSLILPPK